MTLVQAQEVLGPIVCYYFKECQVWTLHQRPAEVAEIIAEAKRWIEKRGAA